MPVLLLLDVLFSSLPCPNQRLHLSISMISMDETCQKRQCFLLRHLPFVVVNIHLFGFSQVKSLSQEQMQHSVHLPSTIDRKYPVILQLPIATLCFSTIPVKSLSSFSRFDDTYPSERTIDAPECDLGQFSSSGRQWPC